MKIINVRKNEINHTALILKVLNAGNKYAMISITCSFQNLGSSLVMQQLVSLMQMNDI